MPRDMGLNGDEIVLDTTDSDGLTNRELERRNASVTGTETETTATEPSESLPSNSEDKTKEKGKKDKKKDKDKKKAESKSKKDASIKNNSEGKGKIKTSKKCLILSITIPVGVLVIAAVVVVCILFIKPKSAECSDVDGSVVCKNGVLRQDSLSEYANKETFTSFDLGEFDGKIDPAAFDNCQYLTEFKLEGENKNYSVVNGVLMNKDGTEIVRIPPAHKGNKYVGTSTNADVSKYSVLELGSEIKKISAHAFYGLQNIRQIKINQSLEKVEDGAFGRNEHSRIVMSNTGTIIKENLTVKAIKNEGGYASDIQFEFDIDSALANSFPSSIWGKTTLRPMHTCLSSINRGVSICGLQLRYETKFDSISFLTPIIFETKSEIMSVESHPFYNYPNIYVGDDIPIYSGKKALKAKEVVSLYHEKKDLDTLEQEGYITWTKEPILGVHFITFKKAGFYAFQVSNKDAKAEYYIDVKEKAESSGSNASTAYVQVFPKKSAPLNESVIFAFYGVLASNTVKIGDGYLTDEDAQSKYETITYTDGSTSASKPQSSDAAYTYTCYTKPISSESTVVQTKVCSASITKDTLGRLAMGVTWSGADEAAKYKYDGFTLTTFPSIEIINSDMSGSEEFSFSTSNMQNNDVISLYIGQTTTAELSWTYPSGATTDTKSNKYSFSCDASGVCKFGLTDKKYTKDNATSFRLYITAGNKERMFNYVDKDGTSGITVNILPPEIIFSSTKEYKNDGIIYFSIANLWVNQENKINVSQSGGNTCSVTISEAGATTINNNNLSNNATVACGTMNKGTINCNITLKSSSTANIDTGSTLTFTAAISAANISNSLTVTIVDPEAPKLQAISSWKYLNSVGGRPNVSASHPVRFTVGNVKSGTKLEAELTKGNDKIKLTYNLDKSNNKTEATSSLETFKDLKLSCEYSVMDEGLDCAFSLGSPETSSVFTGTLTASVSTHTSTIKNMGLFVTASLTIKPTGTGSVVPYEFSIRNLDTKEGMLKYYFHSKEVEGENVVEESQYPEIKYSDIIAKSKDGSRLNTDGELDLFCHDSTGAIICQIRQNSETSEDGTYSVTVLAFNGKLRPEESQEDNNSNDNNNGETDNTDASQSETENGETEVEKVEEEDPYASEENGRLARLALSDVIIASTVIDVEGLEDGEGSNDKEFKSSKTGADIKFVVQYPGINEIKDANGDEIMETYSYIKVDITRDQTMKGTITQEIVDGILKTVNTGKDNTLANLQLSCTKEESTYTCNFRIPSELVGAGPFTVIISTPNVYTGSSTPVITNEFSVLPPDPEDETELVTAVIAGANITESGEYIFRVINPGYTTKGETTSGTITLEMNQQTNAKTKTTLKYTYDSTFQASDVITQTSGTPKFTMRCTYSDSIYTCVATPVEDNGLKSTDLFTAVIAVTGASSVTVKDIAFVDSQAPVVDFDTSSSSSFIRWDDKPLEFVITKLAGSYTVTIDVSSPTKGTLVYSNSGAQPTVTATPESLGKELVLSRSESDPKTFYITGTETSEGKTYVFSITASNGENHPSNVISNISYTYYISSVIEAASSGELPYQFKVKYLKSGEGQISVIWNSSEQATYKYKSSDKDSFVQVSDSTLTEVKMSCSVSNEQVTCKLEAVSKSKFTGSAEVEIVYKKNNTTAASTFKVTIIVRDQNASESNIRIYYDQPLNSLTYPLHFYTLGGIRGKSKIYTYDDQDSKLDEYKFGGSILNSLDNILERKPKTETLINFCTTGAQDNLSKVSCYMLPYSKSQLTATKSLKLCASVNGDGKCTENSNITINHKTSILSIPMGIPTPSGTMVLPFIVTSPGGEKTADGKYQTEIEAKLSGAFTGSPKLQIINSKPTNTSDSSKYKIICADGYHEDEILSYFGSISPDVWEIIIELIKQNIPKDLGVTYDDVASIIELLMEILQTGGDSSDYEKLLGALQKILDAFGGPKLADNEELKNEILAIVNKLKELLGAGADIAAYKELYPMVEKLVALLGGPDIKQLPVIMEELVSIVYSAVNGSFNPNSLFGSVMKVLDAFGLTDLSKSLTDIKDSVVAIVRLVLNTNSLEEFDLDKFLTYLQKILLALDQKRASDVLGSIKTSFVAIMEQLTNYFVGGTATVDYDVLFSSVENIMRILGGDGFMESMEIPLEYIINIISVERFLIAYLSDRALLANYGTLVCFLTLPMSEFVNAKESLHIKLSVTDFEDSKKTITKEQDIGLDYMKYFIN